jgi:hypothetical protein
LCFEITLLTWVTFLLNRGGRAGGYKELDEEEIEETKRRRRQAEVRLILRQYMLYINWLWFYDFFLTVRMMVSCMMNLETLRNSVPKHSNLKLHECFQGVLVGRLRI